MKSTMNSSKLKLTDIYLDTAPLLWALRENEHLWNERTMRTDDPASPHRELDDIWVRYRTPEEAHLPGPHEAVWYPCVAQIPAIPYVNTILEQVKGQSVGGVLLTRIPPGATCHKHIDHGWHAGYYEKFALQVTSAPGQFFHVEDEALETKPGQVFWFDNSHEHWVTNNTPYERITMIVCIKREI